MKDSGLDDDNGGGAKNDAPELADRAWIDELFGVSASVRYVAVYRNGELETRSRAGTAGASDAESDRYEELLVNPTVLKLTSQRGNIDCGGLAYVLIRYGNFFQLVLPMDWGHLSVCIEKDANPVALATEIQTLVGATPAC